MPIPTSLKTSPLSWEFMADILNCCSDSVLVLNEKGVVQTANRTAVETFSCSDPEGKHIKEVCEDYAEKASLISVLEQRQTLETAKYSIRMKRVDAALFYIVCIHGAGRQGETYNKALENSNKDLDEFAHIVSHDLKAPLRAISNLSLWLQEDLGNQLTGENSDNFSKLRNRVMRMEALINGILEYSRVGRQKVENESVDVYTLLQEIQEMLAPPDSFRINIQSEMPVVQAPKVLLLQVFTNLISNAIKYNDKTHGLINISVEAKAPFYQFAVEDNGPGIPAEYHEKIFVIFQTLQSRDKVESSGIGLTIVKKILATVGGKIWLESAPGKGSRFVFTWPDKSSLPNH